ncbi:MAG: 50S ribosomal protein L11 [Zestosphaera tikiterensis]|uniref:Large ribosomal subunit protein uL11 n=1 Tax=Zestosphaera tikiterensis TaxID=1973259 RepID=A0A2R7Y762_9CREN|nr:MAG: 50S ribosomal protein L11 [Zestosphaera tikiterensis]
MVWRTVKLNVKGGAASTQPPLGPTLSQLGLKVDEVVNKINEATAALKGYDVTVLLHVDLNTKNYLIEVKSPSTSSLLLKFAGVNEPSGDPAHKKVGNISFEDVVKVALAKKNELTAKTLKAAVKTIVSTAATIGLTVDGKEPKEVLKQIESGAYDNILLKYEDRWK